MATVTITSGKSQLEKSVQTFEFTDTSFLQDWIDHPENNAGFLLFSSELEAEGIKSGRILCLWRFFPRRCHERASALPPARRRPTGRCSKSIIKPSQTSLAAPRSVAGLLQADGVRTMHGAWTEQSSWDWIDGAVGKTLWPSQETRPSVQPPAPAAGSGEGLTEPLQIASNLDDRSTVTLPFSATGLNRLKEWIRTGHNGGLVLIMGTGQRLVPFIRSGRPGPEGRAWNWK